MGTVAAERISRQAVQTHHRDRQTHASLNVMPAISPFRGHGIQRKSGCACGGACPRCQAHQPFDAVPMQTKLAVNTPGDSYEQEADRVADHVMRMPGPAIQRQSESEEEGEEEEEGVNLQVGEAMLSRASASDEEPEDREAPSIVHQVLGSSGRPLDTGVRGFMESRTGHDFSGVRIHTDAQASESAQSVNALAYTVGNRIVFGTGHYAPGTDDGKKLIAHELTHVIQQGGASRGPASGGMVRAGRSAGTLQRQPAPRASVCGPNVTQQFRGALANIESTYRGWSSRNKLRACQRILIPITPDLQPDINGWDTLPLFQGHSRWLRTPPVYRASRHGPCATPTSSDPSNTDNFAAGHENPSTCSNSVQFENGCWLNGTVNYATFGVMVRLCEGDFTFDQIVRSGAGHVGLGGEESEVLGFIAGGLGMSLIDWAILLIRAYKAARGSGTDSATLPVAWVRAFHASGSSSAPPGGANRSQCGTTCRLTGRGQRWNWVWEPVRPR